MDGGLPISMKYLVYQADYEDADHWVECKILDDFQAAVEMMNLLADLTDDENLYYGIEETD